MWWRQILGCAWTREYAFTANHMKNGSEQEGPWLVSAPQKSQQANSKHIWMLRLLPGRKSSGRFFKTLIHFPEFSSHVIDSLFSLHLNHYSSMTGFWLRSAENKISRMFLLEVHFSLDVFDSNSRTWSGFVTGQYMYVLKSDILIIETLGQGRACWLYK